ncbi:MAG: GIY-YIG nuclease family protein [Phenylobacterium sp.]|uniref:GIY-YIG nuclease family protein n=1 Tax=Phenylobacterium sp. TaxID=1871053 RepID=UPI002735B632|nr:GIY-YIG nuclease family protein [Phenylobacterium sp.]MDP3750080.1 GIY-YIG nuclease family protein [Phenylobacterium sp.]
MRDAIIAEIRRLAVENDGKPPGTIAFVRQTGIGSHKWLGVYWARWSDALVEAGFQPNAWQGRLDTAQVLEHVIAVVREAGRLPGDKEWAMLRRTRPSLPTTRVLRRHFGSRTDLIATLAKRATAEADYADLTGLLPEIRPAPRVPSTASQEGAVYLMKSGDHFKIGRSDQVERRVKEIRIALPEAVALIHLIRTDDPPGIEAYWHRRFADRRANGEWFKLSAQDVAAFRRRTYQ